MGILDRISQIDRKFAWSFCGVLLALFGFWYSRENPASLSIEILSNDRVYDMHADVPQLVILFNGENIKEKKQVLSLVTLRFANNGGRPITQNMYDNTSPFGVKFSTGRLFPADVIDASQGYLRENLHPTIGGQNIVMIDKLVLDPGANFTIKLLVLHAESDDPGVIAQGKIAGINTDRLAIIDYSKIKQKRGFWDVFFEGSLWLHSLRFVFYAICFLLSLFGVIGPIALFSSWWNNHRTSRLEREFIRLHGGVDTTYAEVLSSIAVEHGENGLAFAAQIPTLEMNLRQLKALTDVLDYDHAYHLNDTEEERATYIRLRRMPLLEVIEKLLNAEALTQRGQRALLKPGFENALQSFRTFYGKGVGRSDRRADAFAGDLVTRLKEANESLEPPSDLANESDETSEE